MSNGQFQERKVGLSPSSLRRSIVSLTSLFHPSALAFLTSRRSRQGWSFDFASRGVDSWLTRSSFPLLVCRLEPAISQPSTPNLGRPSCPSWEDLQSMKLPSWSRSRTRESTFRLRPLNPSRPWLTSTSFITAATTRNSLRSGMGEQPLPREEPHQLEEDSSAMETRTSSLFLP